MQHIAIFATHGFKELMQTFAHEMCHQWQFHFGNPSRRAYHNKEFAEKMKSIGLLDDGPLPYLFTQLSDEGVWFKPGLRRLRFGTDTN